MGERTYIVRDAGEGSYSNLDEVYPYTLRRLLAAIEKAQIRSFYGAPAQEIASVGADGQERVIRRYEGGREVHPRKLDSGLVREVRPGDGG